MNRLCRMAFLTGLMGAMIAASGLRADTIKMNNGDEFVGKIVLEGSDFVKIELQSAASSTIKESKMLSRADIKEILKTAEDDLAWEKIQSMVPTPSLMPASNYKTLIETGPKAFLNSFPNSQHKTKVSEILTTLSEELDKVERGYQKIEGEWYTPEDRTNFPMQVESKKRFLAMKNQAAQRNMNGFVQSMRMYQDLEENFFGTPAHAQGLAGAKGLLPTLRDITLRFLRDVEARNAQFEADKAILDPEAQARVVAARERENALYVKTAETDRAAGIKWSPVNINSPEALTAMMTLIGEEITRLNGEDAKTLAERATNLAAIDKLIAEDKLDVAKAELAKVEALPGDGGSKSKKSTKTTTKKKVKGDATKAEAPKPKSYLVGLSQKLADKYALIVKAQEEKEAAATATALAQNIKDKDAPVEGLNETKDGDGNAVEGSEPAAEGDAAEPAKRRNALAGVAETKAVTEKKEDPADNKEKKKVKSTSSSSKGGTDWEAKKAERAASGGGGGGGLPSWAIPAILAVVLGGTVLVLKALGIGGKKD